MCILYVDQSLGVELTPLKKKLTGILYRHVAYTSLYLHKTPLAVFRIHSLRIF
jgi:hypothetical protein